MPDLNEPSRLLTISSYPYRLYPKSLISLCNLCVLCVLCGGFFRTFLTTGGTEDTEVTQRRSVKTIFLAKPLSPKWARMSAKYPDDLGKFPSESSSARQFHCI